jgi:hypothetical protein
MIDGGCYRRFREETILMVSFPIPRLGPYNSRIRFSCCAGAGKSKQTVRQGKLGDLEMKAITGFGKRALSNGLVAASLSLVAFGMLCRISASAQSEDQATAIVKSLDGTSKTVVQRLSQLDRLPAEEWRFHAGDLAHGESPEFDDSSWKSVKPRMDASQDAVWFRRWIEVPQSLHGYDLTGARIWFSFQANVDGPCRRSSISMGVAWLSATTWNRLSSSTRPSPATRCW